MQQATVNLLADMGVQPGTLQPAWSPATASTDTDRADLDDHVARRRRRRRQPARRHDQRHRDRRRRRRGRRRRGLDRRRRHLAPGDRAATNWTYTWTPGATGSGDDQEPRGRRQRQHRDARRRRHRQRHGSRDLPVLDLERLVHARRVDNDTERGRARRQVPLRRRRLHHRPALLQGRRQHRHPRRPPVDAPARCSAAATFSGETATGWQQVSLRDARWRSPPTRPTSPPTTPRTATTPRATATSRPAASTTPPLHALGDGVDGPTASTRTGHGAAFPTDTFQSSNYWVDVVFETRRSAPDTTPPTITARYARRGATGGRHRRERHGDLQRADGRRRRSTAPTFQLRDPSNALVPATVTYDARPADGDPRPEQPRSQNSTDLHGDGEGRARRRQGARRQRPRRRLDLVLHHRGAAAAAARQGPGGPILVISKPPTRSAATTPRSCAPKG